MRKQRIKVLTCFIIATIIFCVFWGTTGIVKAAEKSGYRLIYEERIDDNSEGPLQMYYSYDEKGNMASERWVWQGENREDLTERTFDDKGRIIKSIFTFYDSEGNLLSSSEWHIEYKESKNKLVEKNYSIDADSGEKTLEYMDKTEYAKGRLVREVYYDGLTPSQLIKYKYDKNGNVRSEAFYIRKNGKWSLKDTERFTYKKVGGEYKTYSHIWKVNKVKYCDTYTYNTHGDVKKIITKAYVNGKRRKAMDDKTVISYKYDKAGNIIKMVSKTTGNAYSYSSVKYKWEKVN